MIDTLLLYVFAGMALIGALIMLIARHPMRAALALIATMLSLGGIYGLLGVHVIAVFQVLIYVSAVMVFMVYVIMLLDTRDFSFARRYSRLLIPAGAAFALLVAGLVAASWNAVGDSAGVAAAGASFGVQQFSVAFLNEYWLHFELISVLLVAAVVAAIAIVDVGAGRRG
jgi:NADH-quinone oxidoreductase subunit J